MNDFFIGMGPSLATKIPPKSKLPEAYLKERNVHTSYASPVSTVEIENIVYHLKHAAPGHDKMTPEILKLIQPSVKDPLVHILNLSLSKGIFPSRSQMFYLYTKLMTQCTLIAIDLCHCLILYQRFFEKKTLFSQLISFVNLHKIFV